MSPLENSLVKVPLQKIVQLYSHEIAPRIPKNNKIVSISAAIILSLVYLIIDKAKPPRKLRHFPYISHFSILNRYTIRNLCVIVVTEYIFQLLSQERAMVYSWYVRKKVIN